MAEATPPAIEGGGGDPFLVAEIENREVGLLETVKALLPAACGSGVGLSGHGGFSGKPRTNLQPTSSVKDVFRRTGTLFRLTWRAR
jgi:hypothetical protein